MRPTELQPAGPVPAESLRQGRRGRFLPVLLAGLLLHLAGLTAQADTPRPGLGESKPDTSPGVSANANLDAGLNRDMAAMLTRLDGLIRSSGRDDVVSQTWTNIRQAMIQGRLRFSLGPDSGGNLVDAGARYLPAASGPSTVLVARDLMVLWPARDILVMSLVLNALVFAEGHYLEGEAFVAAWQEPLQGFLYSMDALYVQAVFCRDYAAAFPGEAGGYTGFLAGGINQDGLSGVAVQVLGVDQPLVLALLELKQGLAVGLDAGKWYDRVDSLLAEVEAGLVAALQDQLPGSATAADRHSPAAVKAAGYIAMVSGLTMTRYGALILRNQLEAYPRLQDQAYASRREQLNRRMVALSGQLVPMALTFMPWRAEYLGQLLR